MLLTEFFSKNVDIDKKPDENNDDVIKNLMGYILDDDEIYKKQMLPLIRDLEKCVKDKTYDKEKAPEAYTELVKSACVKFFKKEKIKGDINKIFTPKVRSKICKQLSQINFESVKHDASK